MGKRLKQQRRGRGSIHRAPSHRYRGKVKHHPVKIGTGKIEGFVHCPGHTAPLAKVRYSTGRVGLMLAAEGTSMGDEVKIGASIRPMPGNTIPLSEIPEGTPIYNIEAQIGDGGKFVRAAGTFATVVSQGARTVVQLPSGQFKSFNPSCRATIGIVAGGGRPEKPLLKAGKRVHVLRSKAKKYPNVSGVAMNPYNHPHGGGNHQHVGKPNTVSRNAPPGRKVGRLSPKKKQRRR